MYRVLYRIVRYPEVLNPNVEFSSVRFVEAASEWKKRTAQKNNVHKFTKDYFLEHFFFTHLFVLGLRHRHNIVLHQDPPGIGSEFWVSKLFLVPIFDTNLSCTYCTFFPVPQIYLLKVPSPTIKCKYMYIYKI